jgi:GNAT superfamily N-acetyltransferase
VKGNSKFRTKAKNRRKQFSIRLATIHDCRECAGVLLLQLAERGADASEEKLVKVPEKVLSDKRNGFILVARSRDNIVGVAYVAIILSAEHCGKVGWLEELYVMPRYRSQGIGAALLTAVLEQAHKLGMVAIDLEVDAAHRRAETLYRRFSFRPLDRSRWVRTLEFPVDYFDCKTRPTRSF